MADQHTREKVCARGHTRKGSGPCPVCWPGYYQRQAAKYVALLRGINVGGNNIIKMADLRACFEQMGLQDVATYIQSGNVLFSAREKDTDKLVSKIERSLSKTFSYQASVVLITQPQLKKVVEAAPSEFGNNPTIYRYDVLFLKKPLAALEAMKSITIREGIDVVHAGENVVYFSRLISKASQSYLNTLIKLPIYQHMTIRNWNTTTKLLEKMMSGVSN